MKKTIIILLLMFPFFLFSFAREEPIRVIVFGAYPDDCDLTTGVSRPLPYQHMNHSFLNGYHGQQGPSIRYLREKRKG